MPRSRAAVHGRILFQISSRTVSAKHDNITNEMNHGLVLFWLEVEIA